MVPVLGVKAMSCDRATAKRRLTNRWLEQTELYPTMRQTIPLALYIRQNIGHVMKNDSLLDYNASA
jgi:hypothetical protein